MSLPSGEPLPSPRAATGARGSALPFGALALLVLALVYGTVGATRLHETVQLQRNATAATAEVTQVSTGRSTYLRAEYEARERTWESDTGRFTDEQVGDRIEIRYDRTDPGTFHTQAWDRWTGDYLFAGVFLTMAGAALVAAAGLAAHRMVVTRRAARLTPQRPGLRPAGCHDGGGAA